MSLDSWEALEMKGKALFNHGVCIHCELVRIKAFRLKLLIHLASFVKFLRNFHWTLWFEHSVAARTFKYVLILSWLIEFIASHATQCDIFLLLGHSVIKQRIATLN